MHWAIPLVKLALPYVLDKVFSRDEGKLARFLAFAEEVIEAQDERAIVGETGAERRLAVWGRLEARFPRQTRKLRPEERTVINELILERVRAAEAPAEVALPAPAEMRVDVTGILPYLAGIRDSLELIADALRAAEERQR